MYAATARAYRTVQQNTNNAREVEAAVLSKAARLLRGCQDHWDDPNRTRRLAEAISFNQRIWSFLQSDLARPDHHLPRKLREDVLSLAAFIDKRLLEVVASPAPEKLTVVININLNLASGLNGAV